MSVPPSPQGMGSMSRLHLQSGPFTKVPSAPIAANIPNTTSSSLPQNSWGKVPELSLGWQDSPMQGNADPYLVLQLANQLGQPVDLPLQPLCLGVRGTCTEPGDIDGVRGTCRHPLRALCCCWHLSAPSHPRQPALTSLEALSLLPGDHPGAGRVAGDGVVIPGVTQAVTILAGVVSATREHTGCQDSRAGHTQSGMSQPGSQHWSLLSGSSAHDARALGRGQKQRNVSGLLPAAINFLSRLWNSTALLAPPAAFRAFFCPRQTPAIWGIQAPVPSQLHLTGAGFAAQWLWWISDRKSCCHPDCPCLNGCP